MSRIYETRLEQEFKLLQKLERNGSVRNIINIYYKERGSSGQYKSIKENPIDGDYPNHFKVKYTFPVMYVGRDKIERNWSYAFTFDVSEDILINNAKVDADFFHIDGGSFPDGYIPFNSHVSKNWFCIGSEWESARGLGIWYFIISIGGVLNQDKSEMNIHETVHLNSDAYDYWVNDRKMQPNNNIKWPTNLPELKEITIRTTPSTPKPDKPKIQIKGINK